VTRRSIAVTIAGSDPSGGAGIQADLKTFSALGVYGATVITALTAQNTHGVQGVHAVPPEFVAAQFDSVAADLAIDAVKTGMLANAEIVMAVAGRLRVLRDVPVVVDPVMVSTSGHLLLEPDAIAAMKQVLFPLATLITPNLEEAARLTGRPRAETLDQMADQGALLLGTGCGSVLVKGGHASGGRAVDVLVTKGHVRLLDAERVDTPHTHGTGCTLSAAVAAGLARGVPLGRAVDDAKSYLTAALRSGRDLGVGTGHGPVDHLYRCDRDCS
jgi:hydroxymethylpyrimidine/phosphomethylpyrimidine kinase